MRRRLRLIPIIIAVLVIGYQFLSSEKFTNPETGETHRVAFTPQEEEALGLQSYRQILSQSEVMRSGPEVDLVQRVARRLAAAVCDQGA